LPFSSFGISLKKKKKTTIAQQNKLIRDSGLPPFLKTPLFAIKKPIRFESSIARKFGRLIVCLRLNGYQVLSRFSCKESAPPMRKKKASRARLINALL